METTKKKHKPTNVTKEKLAGTPFHSAEELKKVQAEILEENWRDLERARVRKELVKRDEFRFFAETFEQGLLCKYGENDGHLVRVYLSSHGIQITINEEMSHDESNKGLIGVLVKSMSESFMTSYLKAMGLLPIELNVRDEDHAKRLMPMRTK